ncbi:MAG: nitroreductase family protein [Caldilineaceae bacterium]|nr:nitroreductase family protein [Caldilineaceae bacterium]
MDLATIDRLLTTTRSVRKRLDLTRPVETEVIERCIEIAIQAPTASNAQHWRFLVITDPEKRQAIAAYYRRAFQDYIRSRTPASERFAADDPRVARARKVSESSIYLSRHLHEVPVHIIPCVEGRVDTASAASQAALYGSILPAAWSLMLALRARGVGAAWTTLHLVYERDVAEVLGIPETVTQVALLPVAYYTGDDFRPAARVPAQEVTYWNRWGETA